MLKLDVAATKHMLGFAAAAVLMLTAIPTAAAPSNLIATGRTDTTLFVEWQSGGYTHVTLDYLGPEWFGGGDAQPTCNDFPTHPNIRIVEGDAAVITGLAPSTWYHIHVHAVDPVTHMLLENVSSTNVIIVKTRADASFEALAPGSPQYTICGGGDGGGDGDDGCAQVTFTLLPGSASLPEVQVTLVDPSTGNEVGAFVAPIGQPVPAPEGSFHLRFSATAGYSVTRCRED
jgi:hypothetical protein